MRQKIFNLKIIRLAATLILMMLAASLTQAQTKTPEMNVFGIKLGEKLSLPECRIVENKLGKKFEKDLGKYLYESSADVENVCFTRYLGEFKTAPPFPPPQNKQIKFQFPLSKAPQIAAYTHIDGFVDGQGKLINISFDTKAGDADFILKTLTGKYGKPVSLKDYTQQNVYGATVGNYFIAEWSFPRLNIKFQSADERGGPFSYQGKVIIKAQEAKTDTRTPI